VSTSNDWTQVTLLGLLVLAAAGNVACAPRGEPAAAPSRAVAVVVVEPERPDAAPAEASLDTIEACIDALQSEDRQRRELGERCLRDRSTEALEPLRNASRQHQDGSVRRRADALWRALLDESARQLLAARQVTLLTDPDGAPDWKLMAASDVLPYLRYYKYWDRYPRGVLLDLLEGSEVQRPDEVEYQQLLSRLSRRSIVRRRVSTSSSTFSCRTSPTRPTTLRSVSRSRATCSRSARRTSAPRCGARRIVPRLPVPRPFSTKSGGR
jgi:hypothetical protein